MTVKRNPRDVTERNVRASKTRDEKLKARIYDLEFANKNLERRVKALEKAVAKLIAIVNA